HLDYIRFPNQQFDYSRFSIAQFRAELRPRLSAAQRSQLDAEETTDLFAYPDRFPTEWKSFRRAKLTDRGTRLRTAVRQAKPNAIVSAAVAADARDAFDERL